VNPPSPWRPGTHSGPVRILVVDDNDALRTAVAMALGEKWPGVVEARDGETAIELISDPGEASFDAILCDLRLPGADGFQVLRFAREANPDAAFLLMTAFPTIENAVEAMREGAYDFIHKPFQKPFDLDPLELRVQRAVEHARRLAEVSDLRTLATGASDEFIVAESEAMQAALETAKRVAGIRSTVLLTGETGTGKEVIASLIHTNSPRASGPFIKVNCAALPETLLESELFGHERGAFTGAERQRIGHFEQASGGTLLLDEIAETSPSTQAKLLRVLQDREFYRLGGTRAQTTNARIIAATNRDPGAALLDGSLREDLYYRINVIEIHLDPLRDRREDIEPLAEHYRERFARELGSTCSGFSAAAISRMNAHSWPGNVRELRNAIERAVLLSNASQIDAADIDLKSSSSAADSEWTMELPPNGVSLQTVQRALVVAALRRTGYVQKDAAQLIGVSKRKLNYMIQQMGLVHPSWRRNRQNPGSDSTATPEPNK
jgi:DNA-binding NtrC family response regulator